MQRRVLPLLCVLLALSAGLAACGGGDDKAGETTTAPVLTIPESKPETETETTPAETDTAPANAPSGSEGQGGGTSAPPPTTTTPTSTGPAPGTPESRFEQFCKENPGACG